MDAYMIRYRLYGINNVIHFHSFAAYQNWEYEMSKAFHLHKEFEITEVITYTI